MKEQRITKLPGDVEATVPRPSYVGRSSDLQSGQWRTWTEIKISYVHGVLLTNTSKATDVHPWV